MPAITLPIRAYRVYPLAGQEYDDHNFGHVYENLTLDTEQTAIIAIDLWNLGGDGPPLDPKLGKYWEYNYMGGHGVAKRAGKIMRESIAPLFEAARAASIPIIHNEPECINNRYPWAMPPEPLPIEEQEPAWPPAEFRAQIKDESYRRSFGAGYEEAWNTIHELIDVADCVKPDPQDYIIPQQHQIERFLAERKILNLLYVGFLLNFCLLEKPGGISNMQNRYRTILLRDCTVASETAWSTDEGLMTEAFIHRLEIGNVPSTTSVEFMHALGGSPAAPIATSPPNIRRG